MRKFFVALFFLVGCLSAMLAQEVALLRVGGVDVPLSDFTAFLQRTRLLQKDNLSENNRYMGEAYGENLRADFLYFLRFKLKVADAREKGMDTLSHYKSQCAALHNIVLKEFFTDQQLADSYLRNRFQQNVHRRNVRDVAKLELFTFRLPQHYTSEVGKKAARVMGELYEGLVDGKLKKSNLADWLKHHNVVLEYDGLQWTPVCVLLDEITAQFTNLPESKYSKPFYSPLGIHVVRLKERKSGMDFDAALPHLKLQLEAMGTKSPSFRTSLYNQWKEGRITLPQDVCAQMKKMDEGLLAFYWDKEYKQRTKKTLPPSVLEKYFKAHKKEYRWEFPHYKGAVIHCTSKKAASKIKKRLKKYQLAEWKDVLETMAAEDTIYTAAIEIGLFQIGKNKYIDKLAFRCGEFEPHEKYPYTFIVGKRLKKGPETYTDVLQQVETDCEMLAEKEIFDALYSHFEVEINEDVLKTVNSCGNK